MTTRLIWTVLALLAPVAAAVRAVLGRWSPEGDDATIVLRSREVLHGQIPLQGMRSTLGLTDPALASHHLGPVELHALLPAALVGSGWAVAALCALYAAIVSAATISWAHRLGGDPAVVVFGGGLLVLQALLGPEAMYRPFNPYFGLLPLYLVLVLVTALCAGREGTGWPLVLATGVVTQANLALVPLGAGLGLVAAAVGVRRAWTLRTDRRAADGGGRWSPSAQTVLALTAAVAVWTAVLVEPLRHTPGNLTQVVRGALGDAGPGTGSTGIGWAAERLALLVPLPGGVRPVGGGLVDDHLGVMVVLGWLVVAALVAASLRRWSPRGRSVATYPARVALGAVALLLLTAAVLPTGGLANHYLAGALPVAAFGWAALVWRALLQRPATRRAFDPALTVRIGLGATAVAVVLLGVAPGPRLGSSHTGSEVAHLVLDATAGLPEGAPVVIIGQGYLPSLSTAPAVALAVERRGLRAHYLTRWPHEEDASRLTFATAPPDATRVLLTSGTDETPPGSRLLGSVPSPRGDVDVHVVDAPQP